MRIEYQHVERLIVTLDTGKWLYGERVKPGWILHVLSCYLHMPQSKAGDLAEIMIDDGKQLLELRSRSRDLAKRGMSIFNTFLVGEYQRVIGHAPDSEIGHEICLTVIGEMIPLKRWRKGKV